MGEEEQMFQPTSPKHIISWCYCTIDSSNRACPGCLHVICCCADKLSKW